MYIYRRICLLYIYIYIYIYRNIYINTCIYRPTELMYRVFANGLGDIKDSKNST